jgi:hypothetical protein
MIKIDMENHVPLETHNEEGKPMNDCNKNTISLVVYTQNGKTYMFCEVTNIHDINDKLSFNYEGLTSGKKSCANFINIAGYSTICE